MVRGLSIITNQSVSNAAALPVLPARHLISARIVKENPVLALKNPRRIPARKCAMLLVASAVELVAACSKPVEKVEELRPVRVQQLRADKSEVIAEIPGDVRARVESRLGFRVGGKI